MRLTSSDGTNFSLTIAGYQYPHLETEPYDSNWLDISIDVDGAQGRWQATDPALLTYEVAELADWLETVIRRNAIAECSFTEPCLCFLFVGVQAERVMIQIILNAELCPPWIPRHEGSMTITFALSDAQLRAAASQLRAQLARYPQRAER